MEEEVNLRVWEKERARLREELGGKGQEDRTEGLSLLGQRIPPWLAQVPLGDSDRFWACIRER